MPDTNPKILRLLEEVIDSGRSAEEVCAQYPELLDQLRARLLRYQGVEAQLAALFPPSGSGMPGRGPGGNGEKMPTIPGYELEGILGRGGMGVVYRARHVRLNRTVALKMLLSGDYAAPQEVARFAREAKVIGGLRHENIVGVYDVADIEGRPYFTMEFVDGGSLAQRLAGALPLPNKSPVLELQLPAAPPPMPPRESAALLAKLARAMQLAHENGIVHRDLKPGNILLTRDGVPKISDFGLARRLTGDVNITWSGARIGTPSYMAPEQALGRAGAAGPPVDVYALGAILYEMLTGHPPFQGESVLAIEQKLLNEDPVAPSSINAHVPRDLQTICLKCLEKDPQQRYGTPSALADDLDRFLRGELVAARPAGFVERATRWMRRHPSEATLIIGGVITAFALFGGAIWLTLERATIAQAAREDLREIGRYEAASDWSDARAVLAHAWGRLGNHGPVAVRAQLRQAEVDLDLVRRLDTIQHDRAAVIEGRFDIRSNKARADHQYEEAFAAAGYGTPTDDVHATASRIATSQIRGAILGALDDWAECAAPGERRNKLLTIANLADVPTDERRSRLRNAEAWENGAAIKELTDHALDANPSVQLLQSLAQQLQDMGGNPIPFLRKVQAAHPSDFGVNMMLGDALRKERSPDAIRYFQAAVAVEPLAAVGYNNLGIILSEMGRNEEATEAFRKALALDPAYAPAHNNLGIVLKTSGHADEAVAHYLAALKAAPDDAGTLNNLGIALMVLKRNQEAVTEFQRSLQISPDDPAVHNNMGIALRELGRVDESIAQFLAAIKGNADYREAHANVGIAYSMKKQFDQAIEHDRKALQLKEDDAGLHNNLGLALVGARRLAEAETEYRRAIALDPKDVSTRINLGLALRDQGKLDESAREFREALRIDPARPDAKANLEITLKLMSDATSKP